MSNGNTLSGNSGIITTATVGIFSPDMTQTLLVCNDRIGALVPPGGKRKLTDVNIYHTGLREVWEEVGIDIPVTDGDWLDEKGKIAEYQKIVRVYPFRLGTQAMCDHLFLYRLDKKYNGRVFAREKQGRWYAKRDTLSEIITVQDTAYQVLVPGTREVILSLLQ